MNERIRELAEQAGIDFFNSIDPEFSGREYCEAWTEQQQKFAELIVQECVKCSDQLVSHYIDTHTEKDQALLLAAIADYSSQIKEHFGVEE